MSACKPARPQQESAIMYECETLGCGNAVVVSPDYDPTMIIICDDCQSARSDELEIIHAMLELDL